MTDRHAAAPLLAFEERAVLGGLLLPRERVEAVLRGWRDGVMHTWALTARRLFVLERRGRRYTASHVPPPAVTGVEVAPAGGGWDVRLCAAPSDHVLPEADPARARAFLGALRERLGRGVGASGTPRPLPEGGAAG
jgi:hypothetical protein